MHHSTVPMVPSTLDATVTFPSDMVGVVYHVHEQTASVENCEGVQSRGRMSGLSS